MQETIVALERDVAPKPFDAMLRDCAKEGFIRLFHKKTAWDDLI